MKDSIYYIKNISKYFYALKDGGHSIEIFGYIFILGKYIMATIHQHINHGGYAVQLEVGDYTTDMLQAKGVQDNDVSSLTLAPGYEAILYEHDNFGGENLHLTSSHVDLRELNFNDKLSSIRILTTTPTTSPWISWMPGGPVTVPTGTGGGQNNQIIVFAVPVPPSGTPGTIPLIDVFAVNPLTGVYVWRWTQPMS